MSLDDSKWPEIFTSLRWTVVADNVSQKYGHLAQEDIDLLTYHNDRMLASATAMQYLVLIDHLRQENSTKKFRSYIEAAIPQAQADIEVFKVRVALTAWNQPAVECEKIGSYSADTYLPACLVPCQSMKVPDSVSCRILLDSVTSRSTIFSRHKTSNRQSYDDARLRAGITKSPPTDIEVLLVNDRHEIMEASLCTPYFYRDGGWMTPQVDCGGNQGVTRRLAIEKGFCTEGIILKQDVKEGERIWLSNAVRGFFAGQIQLSKGS